jgi:prevent-host-death family protein
MSIFNVHEAKTHLSRLLERVAAGEEITIARNGRPIARLVPVVNRPRKPGRLKGRIRLAASFENPLPESIARAFRGESR